MNPLTDKEKEQVKELKSQLTEITQTAQVPENYELWTVCLDKESSDPRLEIVLVKFLRAREHDLNKATKMLTDTLIWRKAFKTDELLDETFDSAIFSSVGYLHGQDDQGRPVCYNFYGDLDQEQVFGDVEKFIRWRVQLMERGVQLIDFVRVDSMIQVHDYKDASMFGRSQNSKNATKEIIKIMQDNYPEFLVTKYFVNVPWWGSDEIYSQLTKAIPKQNLPKVYLLLGPKTVPENTQPSALETHVSQAQQTQAPLQETKERVEAAPKDSMEIEQVPETSLKN